MGKYVKYELVGEIGLITIDNPPVNAFSRSVMDDLTEIFKKLKITKLRTIIITGSGKAFMAGADINTLLSMKTEEEGLAAVKEAHEQLNNFADMEFPTIAAVNGFALGGGTELALACDIRIASAAALFGLTEVSLGILPGGGGTQRLSRLIGAGRAKMLIFSAKIIDAYEALKIGLVDSVVEPNQLMPEAMKLAQKIAVNSPVAVRAAKKAINEGLDVSLANGLVIERKYFAQLIAKEDHLEGAKAFLEKRKPIYRMNE